MLPDSTDAQAREALKQLVRLGLLRISTGYDERWEFTHVLTHSYADKAARTAGDGALSECLVNWIIAEIRRPKTTNSDSRSGDALSHAYSLLGVGLPSAIRDKLAKELAAAWMANAVEGQVKAHDVAAPTDKTRQTTKRVLLVVIVPTIIWASYWITNIRTTITAHQMQMQSNTISDQLSPGACISAHTAKSTGDVQRRMDKLDDAKNSYAECINELRKCVPLTDEFRMLENMCKVEKLVVENMENERGKYVVR